MYLLNVEGRALVSARVSDCAALSVADRFSHDWCRSKICADRNRVDGMNLFSALRAFIAEVRWL